MARERDINDILEGKADKLRERVEDNIDKFRDHVDEVRDRIEEVADDARTRGEEAWKDASKFTQKHPMQALGIAAVVGAALGLILFGGRNRD